MKLAPNQIDTFVKSPKNQKAILIYGPDAGSVSLRAEQIIKATGVDKYNIYKYSYNEISTDISILSNIILNYSFLNPRKAIVIDCGSIINQDIKSIISKNDSQDVTLIFTAGELTPSSTLRKFFDNDKECTSIACYKDDARTIRQLIQNKFREEGASIDIDALQFLESNLQGDRRLIQSEVDKIILYLGDKKSTSLEDILACLSGNIDYSMDEFASEVFKGNADKVQKLISHILSDGNNHISLIRGFKNYLDKIYKVHSLIKKGSDIEAAISKLSPPIFFKHKPDFTNIIRKTKLTSLISIIEKLAELETNCKQTGYPVDIMVERFFLNLAHYYKK